MSQIGCGLGHFDRNIDLDAGIAEPLAESAGHQYKSGLTEVRLADRLIKVVFRIKMSQINLIRLLRDKTVKRISTGLGFLKQNPCI